MSTNDQGSSGGAAAAGGFQFQADIGAYFAAHALAERHLVSDWGFAGDIPVRIFFETSAPVDDILVETKSGNRIFVQAKTTIALSAKPDSALSSALDQAVRLYLAAGAAGSNSPYANLNQTNTRVILAVEPRAPRSVLADLSSVLARTGSVNSIADLRTGLTNQAQREALAIVETHIARSFSDHRATPAQDSEILELLKLIRVASFALKPGEPDRRSAISELGNVVAQGAQAEAAFTALSNQALRLIATRDGLDMGGWRRVLETASVDLRAAPSYADDITRLRTYSESVAKRLAEHEGLEINGARIKVVRECEPILVDGARTGHLLVVGEPGAGKSGVIGTVAAQLRDFGDVVTLAVDELAVSDLDGIRRTLDLDHSIIDVLANGFDRPLNFLVIDALDASRGGPSEQVFATLINRVITELPGWRVVATVREFDLRLGKRFQDAFRGKPPAPSFAHSDFPNVRNVHVKPWSDSEILQLADASPVLARPILHGSPKFRDVVRVPFNTRLVAELLDNDVPAEAFQDIDGQVQLLDFYWARRVDPLGLTAEATIIRAIGEMAANRRLYVDLTALPDTIGLTQVLAANLLVRIGTRSISFRHHLLFDYVAARFLLDAGSMDTLKTWTVRAQEAALLLAPAVALSLSRAWRSTDTQPFWTAILWLCGSPDVDPIVRAIAGRAAANKPQKAVDVAPLVAALLTHDKEELRTSLDAIVGAVVAMDITTSHTAPWIALASAMQLKDCSFPFSVNGLLYWMLSKGPSAQDPAVGQIARQLLASVLEDERLDRIIINSINSVGKTYGTNVEASREAFRALIAPERMRDHAPKDMQWLTRQIEQIIELDPRFAVDVYSAVFGHQVSDDRRTNIGDSQILPLSSTTSQDFKMAQWALAEAFPKFLAKQPGSALNTLVACIRTYVHQYHPVSEVIRTSIPFERRELVIEEDASYIWAADPDDEHPDNAERLIQAAVEYLRQRTGGELVLLVREMLPNLDVAVLWARLFMVCAEKPEAAELMYPIILHPPVVHINDIKKDAIDLLGAVLARRSASEQDTVLQTFAAQDYSIYTHPDDAKEGLIRRIRSAIARGKSIVDPNVDDETDDGEDDDQNRRLFRITTGRGSPRDEWAWLARDGVDPYAETNLPLLEQSKALSSMLDHPSDGGPDREKADQIVGALNALLAARHAARQASEPVLNYTDGVIGRGAHALVSPRQAKEWPDLRRAAREFARVALESSSPSHHPDELSDSISWGSPSPRIEAAETIIDLARFKDEMDDDLRTLLQRCAADPVMTVRHQIATKLSHLYETDPDLMWSLAQQIAENEPNRAALRYFANYFLTRVTNAAPAKVDALVSTLYERSESFNPVSKGLREEIANLSIWLAVWHDRPTPAERIEEWIEEFEGHEDELGDVVQFLREAYVLGLGEDDERNNIIRSRALAVAGKIAVASATRLEAASRDESEDPGRADRAREAAKLLDAVGMQLYFAFAPREPGQREREYSLYPKQFLSETQDILHLLARAGTPHTTHQLLELLQQTVDAEPELTWDLIAEALLVGGKRYGYAAESMGADLFVGLVGRYLADYKSVFNDATRRTNLIDTIDLFNRFGWPAARKFLNDLPDLLR
jgi:hypothetical protein